MKENFKMGIKLMSFGISKTANIVMMILFIVGGIGMEIIQALSLALDGESFFGGYDLGAVFLICAFAMPAQLILSVDVCDYGKLSGHRRMINSGIPAIFMGMGAVLSLVVAVIVRLIVRCVFPELGTAVFHGILGFALLASFLIIYFSFVYKYFVVSIIILYIIMFSMGMRNGYRAGELLTEGSTQNVITNTGVFSNPVVSILISLVMLIAAAGINYLLTRAFYKRPYSKYAFGAAMRRHMK